MATKKQAKRIKPTTSPEKTKKIKAALAKAIKAKVLKAKTSVSAPVPVQTKPKEQVSIAKAKGRPMLSWVGKRPLRSITAFPAQPVENFTSADADKVTLADPTIWKDWPENYPQGGLLFHGDNKEVLAHLLAEGFRGKVQLIYIDPPFDSRADYVRKVSLRGAEGSAKLEGESYVLGEQIQYSDIWANDNYLQFMYERLLMLKELLAEDGSLYLHCDWHKSHQLRCLLDEVFGSDRLVNEVVWQRTFSRAASKTINNIHDVLLIYSRGDKYCWNKVTSEPSKEYIEGRFSMIDDKTGKRFQGIVLTAPGLSGGETGREWRGFNPSSQGRHWANRLEERERMDAEGLIYWPSDGGWPRRKWFADGVEGVALQSIWTDLAPVNSQAQEGTGFPTQKPEALLDRIVEASSSPGGLVLV